jgi:hypothetical protein
MQIETNRLLLQQLTLEQVGSLFVLDSDPAVMKYLGRPPVGDESAV